MSEPDTATPRDPFEFITSSAKAPYLLNNLRRYERDKPSLIIWVEAGEDDTSCADHPGGRRAGGPKAGFRTMHILLADDERNFALVFRRELEEEGHAVDLVFNGIDAVLSFIDRRHDFILLDIRMPGLDGVNALRIIRRLDPHVPALIFSGNASPAEIDEAVRAGALGCLTKPFDMSAVKASIVLKSSGPGGRDGS